MNTPQIERLVTAALRADAEDAMNRTSTTEQLQSLNEAAARNHRKRRGLLAAGALAAAAAVVVAVAVSWNGGDPDSAPVVEQPTEAEQAAEAEQVAVGFVDALASFDRESAATYIADGVQLTMSNILDETAADNWTLRNRWDQATGWEVTDLEGCHTSASRPPEFEVHCVYTVHQMGSDQLGRGPFGDNALDVTVRDGQIVDVTLTTAHGTNGFSDTMWGPFWAWMEETHPADEGRMAALEDPGASPARVNRSLRLWHQRVQQYVDAVQAGEAE
jgi:hypothetical protein